MFRALFRVMIVLSIFAAASSASADGEDKGTASVVDIPPSLGGGEVTVAAEDNSTETLAGDLGDEDAIASQNENETASEEVSAEAEAPASPAGAPLSFAATMAAIPADADVYVDLAEGKVYNDDRLVVVYVQKNEAGEQDFPGVAMVQFNLSGIEVGEDDVAVLVMKAESAQKGSENMTGIVIAPVTSEWTEGSSLTALMLNILATVFVIAVGDYSDFSQMGLSFGGDGVYAFDVSEHLAGLDGERASFLVMAFGDTDYRVAFKSRETGEGPTLLIGPYPSTAATV